MSGTRVWEWIDVRLIMLGVANSQRATNEP